MREEVGETGEKVLCVEWPVYKFFFYPKSPFRSEIRITVSLRSNRILQLSVDRTRDDYMEYYLNDGMGMAHSIEVCNFVFGDKNRLPVASVEIDFEEYIYYRISFILFDKVLFVQGGISNAENFLAGYFSTKCGYKFPFLEY